MPSYDTRFLPPCETDFTIVSDTHDCEPDIGASREFPSRSLQRARSRAAFEAAAALDAEWNFHLGDLVQLYPESTGFDAALERALELMRNCGFRPNSVVPGNHDVGDKPDSTMPTHPSSETVLASFEARFGASRGYFDAGPSRFIWLNSQLMGTGINAEAEQWEWLKQILADTESERRIIALIHLPPFIENAEEPAAGHYDNLDRVSRRRLLELLESCANDVTVIGGHVHHRFRSVGSRVHYFTAASPAFTRPGYGHLFDCTSASERGRDDRPKLGFFYGRIKASGDDLHFIRTSGRADNLPSTRREIVTPLAGGLPGSSLGVHLLEPLTQRRTLPETFPATIRQPVRNDYPELALEELGVASVKSTLDEFLDPVSSRSFHTLRSRGVHLTATELWSTETRERDERAVAATGVDSIEWRLPDAQLDPSFISFARNLREMHGIKTHISPVFPLEPTAGKQHPRPRFAFRKDEAKRFLEEARNVGLSVDRLVLEWDSGNHLSYSEGPPVDYLLGLNGHSTTRRLAEAMFFAAHRENTLLHVSPLLDLDRTMDEHAGLLDRRCNPNPIFNLLRILNAVLFQERANPFTAEGSFRLRSGEREFRFIDTGESVSANETDRLFYLYQGTLVEPGEEPTPTTADEPMLIEESLIT